MKKLLSFCFVGLLVLSFCGISLAQNIVTSKELSIEDVEPAVLAGRMRIADNYEAYPLDQIKPGTIKVLGVHQTGNTATVFIAFESKQQGKKVGFSDLVRFNSGQWFSPRNGVFLTR